MFPDTILHGENKFEGEKQAGYLPILCVSLSLGMETDTCHFSKKATKPLFFHPSVFLGGGGEHSCLLLALFTFGFTSICGVGPSNRAPAQSYR